MANDSFKIFVGIISAVVVLWALSQFVAIPGATTKAPTNKAEPGAVLCPVAPTVQLGANDKYESGQTNWGNWKYKLNGGTTQTDADGSFEVTIDDKLQVLVADGNSSTYYRAIWQPEITKCGIN